MTTAQQITLSDVPRHDCEDVDAGHGYTFSVTVEHDPDMGAPWQEHDGHGIVSEWTTRDKRPGELVLTTDRHRKAYYDLQATMIKARAEGWDADPIGEGTKGQRAARAVRADFERMRGWANDEWQWVGVCVKVMFHGEEIGADSLWGIESDGDYWREVACGMINDAIAGHAKARRHAANAARKERAEVRYWNARDVVTA